MKAVYALPLLFLPIACTSDCSRCGWSFQVGKPPVITQPVIVNPTQTAYGAAGMCSGPTGPNVGPVVAPPPMALPAFAAPVGPCIPTSYGPPPATLGDVLDEIRRLNRSLAQPPAPARALPMPKSDCSLTNLVLCGQLVPDQVDGEQ